MPRKRKKTKIPLWLTKSALLVGTLVILFGILEVVFAFFFIAPDSTGQLTLSSRRWYERHWKPINSFGFRDPEYDFLQLKKDQQRILFVIGDSFVAGSGIENTEDRFSNVLQKNLGKEWFVINMAQGGWGTYQQIRQIQVFPIQPDAMVLSYYVNDIEPLAKFHRIQRPSYVQRPHDVTLFIVENSRFLNFVYWRLYRFAKASLGGHHLDWLKDVYQNEVVWNDHIKELKGFADFAKGRGIPLIVVIFPNLMDVAGSSPITKKVSSYFASQGVLALDLTSSYKDRPPLSMMVNRMDHHPNESIHTEVGEMLTKAIEDKFLQGQ